MTNEPRTANQPEAWIFTFGSGQQHDGRFVVIAGSPQVARDIMFDHFGNRWSFQYPATERAEIEASGMTELPRSEWSVTLTPEQLTANLLLAVENVIAAGQLDWESGLDVEGIQSRAHGALVEAYQAVTR